tara:strand:+ start:628 stop:1425 length:798 start_codon:yes stop_codon:yes gene_type:complete
MVVTLATDMPSEVVRLEVRKLRIDTSYQRPIKPAHVDKIVENFDPSALGAISVSDRGNGDYVVLDGRHRVAVCQQCGHSTILAVIHQVGGDIAREAQLFIKLNFSKIIGTAWEWRARVVAKDPIALEVNALAWAHGFRCDPLLGMGPTTITAVSAMEDIFGTYGPDTLIAILDAIRGAWPNHVHGREAGMIRGLGQFITMYPGHSPALLVKHLRRVEPEAILTAGRTYQKDLGGRTAMNMARAIWKPYNFRLTSKSKLPNRFDSE